MNVIRYFCESPARIEKYPEIVRNVESELSFLNDRYEFHILGNHLLENAFAMLMGGHFFNRPDWIDKSKVILHTELKKQILEDGAHFELSPMYHLIILFRVLEAINYLPENDALAITLRNKAEAMIGWISTVSFSNGSISHFNDSTDNIAYTVKELIGYAEQLDIHSNQHTILMESGYRKFKNSNFECIIDVNGISPSYQPGHAHADHLSFVLSVDRKPFIVDPGISTYEIDKRRQWERSSSAHNTVTIDNNNWSEVWGGFRVAARAKVIILKESSHGITAFVKSPFKYFRKRMEHQRECRIEDDNIQISDMVTINRNAVARYFLHPDVEIVVQKNNQIDMSNGVTMIFESIVNLEIKEYLYNRGYNLKQKANVIEATFIKNNIVRIQKQ